MSGEGGLFKRTRKRPDGTEYVRWVAQVSYGPRHDRHVVRRMRRTKREAKAALDEMLGPRQSSQHLGDWLRYWLAEVIGPSLAPNTIRGHEAAIASLRAIHAIPLADLAETDIERCLNRLKARRRGREEKDWRPASPKTRKNALAILRQALTVAHRRGHVIRNVADEVAMPRVPRVDHIAMTPERAKIVLEATKKDRYAAAYTLGLCGLRIGEVLGLAWEDVDLDAGTVLVRWQAVGSGKRAQRAQLKTYASESPLALPPFATERLTEHRRKQREERLAKGWPQLDEGHVFITERGYVVNASWLTKHLQELLTPAKMEAMTFHDLRHGTATLLAAGGVDPRLMQRYMRHAHVGTTLNVYTHIAQGREREAADALERMVMG